MQKIELWSLEAYDVKITGNTDICGVVVPSEEIGLCVETYKKEFIVTGGDARKLETALNDASFCEKLVDYIFDKNERITATPYIDIDDLQVFFKERGYADLKISVPDDLECVEKGKYILNFNSLHIGDIDYIETTKCDSIKVYRYWSGSNWKEIWLYPYENATRLTLSDESVMLDVFDGSNYYTKQRHIHEHVYKVYEMDGKDCDDMYFILQYSNIQGGVHIGEVVSSDLLSEYLNELGRDVGEYMAAAKELK